ncbi:MAG: hypothetical protein EHM89_09605 [Acidobacteria bacterium]|nr:MAG: hypothetical protein EHM89_09605 [Acidobacteriota bacterium]
MSDHRGGSLDPPASAREAGAHGFLDVAPELVVEILSPENAHIDMRQKVEEAIGAGLVLVVDPDTHTITAHRPSGAVDRHVLGHAVTCEDVLPGVVLPVAAAFE